VEGLTVQKMMDHDKSSLDKVMEAAEALKKEGVRAITSDCGFMALYQKEMRERLDIPVFLSSLLQIPFIGEIISYGKKIGIITANGKSLTEDVIRMCGIDQVDNLVISGLEDEPNFSSAFLHEEGFVDTDEVEREVVGKALQLQKENPDIGAILLECSVLPPYAEAVQEASGLPVFDFVTMINYVFSAVVRESGRGFM